MLSSAPEAGTKEGTLSAIRTRWAAIGAAVAVSIGGGGLFMARAADSTSDSAYHPVTPVRVLDTRSSTPVQNASTKLKVEGTINTINADGTTTSQEVVPSAASAVAINITVTQGAKNGDYGYVSAFPCTATTDTPPNASSINFENRVDIANALNVTTSSTGEICLYVYGTAHLIVDVAGYYDDSRLDAIEADYVDNDAPITMTYPGMNFETHLTTTVTNNYPWGSFTGIGSVGIPLELPSSLGQSLYRYRLSSLSLCWPGPGASANGAYISDVEVYTNGSEDLYDFTTTTSADFNFTTSGCKTYSIPTASQEGGTAYYIRVYVADSNGGTGPILTLSHVNATYVPYSVLLSFPLIPLLPFESE